MHSTTAEAHLRYEAVRRRKIPHFSGPAIGLQYRLNRQFQSVHMQLGRFGDVLFQIAANFVNLIASLHRTMHVDGQHSADNIAVVLEPTLTRTETMPRVPNKQRACFEQI